MDTKAIADAIIAAAQHIGAGNSSTQMGAIEFHAVTIKNAADNIADAIRELAEAIRENGSSI